MRVPEPFDVQNSRSPRCGWSGRQELRALGSIQSLSSGALLCAQGDDPRNVFLLESGTLVLYCLEQEGTQHVLGLRTEGTLVGSTCTILGEPSPFSASAASPLQVVAIDRYAFLKAHSGNPRVSRFVVEAQSQELHAQFRERVQLLSLTAAQRIEDLLWRLAKGAETPNARLRLPFPQTVLARWLGVTPQYVTTIIKRLEKRGILLRSRKGTILMQQSSRLWHVGKPEEERRFLPPKLN